MSVPHLKPCFLAGTVRQSGHVQLGEILTTTGGYEVFTNYSGTAAGNDVMIASGLAGRLLGVMQLTQMVSGQTVLFYDGAINTSGGPFAASGHKVVAAIPSTYAGGAVSGTAPVIWNAGMIRFDTPFYSGLIAATRSGTPGFSVMYTTQASGVI